MNPPNALEITSKNSADAESHVAPVVKLRPSSGVTAPVQRVVGRPWAKGQSGNLKGRPKGAWSRRTIGANLAQVLARKGKGVLKKAIEVALTGDVSAMRLILERALPKERIVVLPLPKIRCARDAMEALAVIMDSASEGTITPAEASNLSSLARAYVELSEMHEVRQRLADIEARLESQ